MNPLVGLIMGSDSDWTTVEPAADVLADLAFRSKWGWSLRTELQSAC